MAAIASTGASDPETMTHRMTILVLELAAIILVARAGGYIFSRYLKQPAVLGELCAGMLIGPYALGGFNLPIIGKLFTLPHWMLPVSPELYGIATVASIVLLFLAGLETDISMFIKYSVAGTIIGAGGALGAFISGDIVAVLFGAAPNFMHPSALFLGAISTATSVGITARILTERKKLDSPEGVTILAAAVIDDVLGIIVLAIIIGISKVSGTSGGEVNWSEIGIISAKAFGFWILCTILGLALAKRISKTLKWFRSSELIVGEEMLELCQIFESIKEISGTLELGQELIGSVFSSSDDKSRRS